MQCFLFLKQFLSKLKLFQNSTQQQQQQQQQQQNSPPQQQSSTQQSSTQQSSTQQSSTQQTTQEQLENVISDVVEEVVTYVNENIKISQNKLEAFPPLQE
jgi:uncharacterized FlaG/YvyC family protein